MLRGILGFLPLVLDLAGTFLGLAPNCLSLALSLLAHTHDGSLLCPAAPSAATYGPRSSCAAGDAALRWLHVPRRMKLKPSRYHVVSSSRICGAGPAQERLRSLKAGRGEGKQPKAAGNAGHPAEDRAPCEDGPGDTAKRPFGSARTVSQPAQDWRQIGGSGVCVTL